MKIFAIVVLSLTTLIMLIRFLVLRKRKKKLSTWRVGDDLEMFSHYMETAKSNGLKYPKLIRWDLKELIIDLGDDMETLVEHVVVNRNNSAFWRKKYASMKKFMTEQGRYGKYKSSSDGKKVTDSKMDITNVSGDIHIDGKPIKGMNETYLRIYLGYAIEEEKYEIAAKIKEELKENHR